MRFDLTKNTRLDPVWQKRYFILRLALYLLFILAGAYFIYYIFFYRNSALYYDGVAGGADLYSAYSDENFSSAKIQLSLNGKYPAPKAGEIAVRKTYQAFTYPVSEKPAGFPDSSLVKNDGDYYIVSDGKLRKFASFLVAADMGYSQDSFQEAAWDELNYNEKGDGISSAKSYPDAALFLADGNYYKLYQNTLSRFVSEKAYLSYFDKRQAIQKNRDFLGNYPISEEPVGFANGTLLSFDIAAFIVVDGKIMPFNNPITFLSFGYQWDDIIPATGDEIGLYQRDKLFTVNMAHPDGTVFLARDTGKYYLIANGQKQEIKGTDIVNAYRKRHPILTDEKSLEFQSVSILRKNFLSPNQYRSTLSVTNLEQFLGNEYQFKISGIGEGAVSQADLVFQRNINIRNIRTICLELKNKILMNYGYSPQ